MSDYQKELRIKIPLGEALAELEAVALTYDWFKESLPTYWRPEESRYSSMCWLFCWAQNGRNKKQTTREARRAFNSIFEEPFDSLQSEWVLPTRTVRPV